MFKGGHTSIKFKSSYQIEYVPSLKMKHCQNHHVYNGPQVPSPICAVTCEPCPKKFEATGPSGCGCGHHASESERNSKKVVKAKREKKKKKKSSIKLGCFVHKNILTHIRSHP